MVRENILQIVINLKQQAGGIELEKIVVLNLMKEDLM
jgi:hypothetical protein